VVGTRPEAIKLAPVILGLRDDGRVDARVCMTSQHGTLAQDVFDLFSIVPDVDLRVMTESQTLSRVAARVLEGLEQVLHDDPPDIVIVEGDTTSVLAATIAAFHLHIPVAHVEAGLRTYDVAQPFPEEANRRIVTTLASLHLAATEHARANLRAEGVPDDAIVVTGNPGLDALRLAQARPAASGPAGASGPIETHGPASASEAEPASHAKPAPDAETALDASAGGLILVTAHRRESFGPELSSICRAVRRIAHARGDLRIVFPVHPNPQVEGPVHDILDGVPNVSLIPPLAYADLVELLGRVMLVLTDSGGLQEEAPACGKPVLVLRETTERPEAVEAGAALLVGRDEEAIVAQTLGLLDDGDRYLRMAVPRPIFGDGHAAPRIIEAILR
jgi:UDP-N-acetylglucosamine 2-epimerase (non-hydrolysing)